MEKWEKEKIKNWSIREIKNSIFLNVDCGQPIRGCVSLEALREELLIRGEEAAGYHNT